MRARRAAGFTIVELLTTISVIVVLLSITAPALRNARKAATAAKCVATMRSVMQGHALWSTSHANRWLSIAPPAGGGELLDPQVGYVEYIEMGQTLYDNEGLDPLSTWVVLLRDYIDGADISGQAMSCPEVWRNRVTLPHGEVEVNPQHYPMRSFYYSASLFTEPRMWNPHDAESLFLRRNPWLAVTAVSQSDVAHPAAKVAMFEHHEHHGDSAKISNGLPLKLSLGFADGHASRNDLQDAASGVAGARWPFVLREFEDGEAIPFATTVDGFLGRDF